MKRVKQAIYLTIGGFLVLACIMAFSPASGPEANGFNFGVLSIGVLFVWLTVRAVKRA